MEEISTEDTKVIPLRVEGLPGRFWLVFGIV